MTIRNLFSISSFRMDILTSVPSLHWDVELGYQLVINISSHIILRRTWLLLNILGPVSMDNFVAMGAGERSGGGGGKVRVLIEIPGEGDYSVVTILHRS